MAIQNFPAALVPIIQTNMLEREFIDGLQSDIGFDAIADVEEFSVGEGETITKTRAGLKTPVTTPMVPANNTNLDNGMTPSGWTVEQYTIAINQYGDTIDLNTVTSRVGIASQFLQNAKVNGIQAQQSRNRLAKNALFGAYLGGNTRVRVTLGAAALTVSVDDIHGFQSVLVNGVQTAVSAVNTMTVTVGATAYTLTGAAADGVNVSTAPNGISGVLTFSANVSVADGTAGNAVVSAVAPVVSRPNSRTNTSTLIATDLLTMQMVLAAAGQLRSNAVPTINGSYNCYLDNVQLIELFQDGDFKLLFRGAYGSEQYRQGMIIELLGVRFIVTNEAPQQTLGAVKVHRAVVLGQGALIRGDFAGMADGSMEGDDGLYSYVDGIVQVTREPLDRLKQIIAQSWFMINGFAVPSDVTANTNIIPTASNSYYKRGVVLETA